MKPVLLMFLCAAAMSAQAQTSSSPYVPGYIFRDYKHDFISANHAHKIYYDLGVWRDGRCILADELVVDGKIVEARSCDLKHVSYAAGWNRAKVDAAIRYVVEPLRVGGKK